MLNICFVAHFAYGAATGGHHGHVGGVERQTSLMAMWLAKKGHNISLLTWQEGTDNEETINGIRIIKICKQDQGLPIVRFFHPRWSGLIQAMSKANADIYYHNCGEYVTGQVALYCKLKHRQFVYSLANDTDADPSLPEMKPGYERTLYKYGLVRADKVISQTRKQANMLKAGFGLDSQVMPMPCPGPGESEYIPPSWPNSNKPTVLWAARLHPSKRLDILLDTAECLPDFDFLVAGKPDADKSYVDPLLERMKQLKNVRYLGAVERSKMPEHFSNAIAFCSSSDFEGFPNTFLEAWSFGLPIVSTFDPDNLIVEKKLGLFAQSKNELVNHFNTLKNDQTLWKQLSSNARDHYLNNYTEQSVMERFEEIFYSVNQGSR